MWKTACALCCALVVMDFAVQALAQPAAEPPAGTNFPELANYPGPNCTKPAAPPKQPNTTNGDEVDRYNMLIREYNRAGRAYVVCINSYIRNADHDMDLIREKSRDAADQANR
jgi:hypothetical protein